jgi:hypothetical protein
VALETDRPRYKRRCGVILRYVELPTAHEVVAAVLTFPNERQSV